MRNVCFTIYLGYESIGTQDSLDSLLPRVHTCNKRKKRVLNGLIGCIECVLRIIRLECNCLHDVHVRSFSMYCIMCMIILDFIVHGQFYENIYIPSA